MKKALILTIFLAALGLATPAIVAHADDKAAANAAQPPSDEAKKVEGLLTATELPFTKTKDGNYTAVITVEDESERFVIIPDRLGDDPNKADFQFIKLYFHLGDLPEGVKLSTPLAKQLAEWNSNLAIGKVVVEEGTVWYTSTLWLSTTDANALGREAVIGQIIAKDLRKQVAPYLKQ